jgi:hypothetical protein
MRESVGLGPSAYRDISIAHSREIPKEVLPTIASLTPQSVNLSKYKTMIEVLSSTPR